MTKSKPFPQKQAATDIIEKDITKTIPICKLEPKTQQVHFFAPSSSSENGYDPGINKLIREGRDIVCMQLTREHLVVISEG